ncbi:hypothetical protein CB0940_02279 [Cercospora beticola]|uniref:L-dopachrome isomerase n=1 Tax=Cercospora beticola TaxID=122368 RepID=A0A2G5I3J8_CERBT|nr:hypothetical protein CB0940_02279 [Cercospora beticola]PIA99377.1 hypothetical protein CB0940_02279 [Cercospora beticola]WPA99399.1 hypothetical protein RHO25_004016 [Cercospora beticola]
MPQSDESSSADAPSSPSRDSSLHRMTDSVCSTKPTDAATPLDDKFAVLPANKPRDRSSLPAELAGSANFGDFVHKHLGTRESVMAAPYTSPSRQRTQYYDEQFHHKDNANGSVRERVQRDSPVIAELRTNVIVKDEFTLVTDLSYHLAARYTRPDSSVMVKVDHSACLALGGTFEPCYIIAITAVPSQMGPTMNKRNAALIQSFLADILSVSPERGIIKFQPIPDENFAINGTTILGEIERQEKRHEGEHAGSMRRAMNSMGRKSMPSFKKSLPKMDGEVKNVPEPTPTPAETRPAPARADSAVPSNASEDKSDTTPTQMSANITSPGEVYELPAIEVDKDRPVTAHERKSSGGSNGLRMNGVSQGAVSSSRSSTPKNGKKARPRTFSGENFSARDQPKSKSIGIGQASPTAKMPATHQTKNQKAHSFLKHDPTNTSAKASLTNTSRPTSPRQRNWGAAPAPVIRTRDSPDLANAGPQAALKALSGTWTNESAQEKSRKKIEKLTGEKPDVDNKKDTEANTAKRRSTITATPKYPEPPPIPVDKQDSKSLNKVGKRKSFLSAFRRHALPQAAH